MALQVILPSDICGRRFNNGMPQKDTAEAHEDDDCWHEKSIESLPADSKHDQSSKELYFCQEGVLGKDTFYWMGN
ncbi:hypothetical protein L3Y34_012936 [Caenorhabditis briggsae]|uniref:Uncharacterized protein n=1 Tax=Caenorhabditis briggsae TaxID=6238 RepID=A0AAE9CWG7_CAEBR|nr:hypothetical protein L3Y34_012936 [Caenorhabditis briggsae]